MQELAALTGAIDRGHANHMVARINMQAFAGNTRAEIAEEVERALTHFFLGHIALQRCVVLVPAQNIAEITNTAGSQGLDWTGRNRVHPHILFAHIDREILDGGFQGRLGNAHHIVVRHYLLSAVIGEGEN